MILKKTSISSVSYLNQKEKKVIVGYLMKIGFTYQEIFIWNLSGPFLVPEECCGLKYTFYQFMFNYYNKENLLKDVKVDIRPT